MSDESTTPSLTACVLHTGRLSSEGYGKWNGTSAQRAAWVATHGPVASGLEIHHVCENKACVNVAHLLPVTTKQHRALHSPTHCVNGHLFDVENTYVRSDNGRRQCRACNRVRVARYKKRSAA